MASPKAGSGDEAQDGPARLPAGRHGLPREFIAQNQRDRLIAAVAAVVAEHGYNASTVAQITTTAGVSRRTFYEHFANKEECFLAAYEALAEHIIGLVREAGNEAEDWPRAVRDGLALTLDLLSRDPALARFGVVEPITATPEIAARHRETLHRAAVLLEHGRPARDDGNPLPDATEEAIVGGVASVVTRQINAGRAESLPELLPDLVELVLTPYLGAEEGKRLARDL